jgi:hypothetical protein
MSKRRSDIVAGFVRTAAIETEARYGRRTYYGGTVEVEPPDTEDLTGPKEPRLVKAIENAFEEIVAGAQRIPLFRTGVRPDPRGKLHVVETFDAETGKLILTWRFPFIESSDENVH